MGAESRRPILKKYSRLGGRDTQCKTPHRVSLDGVETSLRFRSELRMVRVAHLRAPLFEPSAPPPFSWVVAYTQCVRTTHSGKEKEIQLWLPIIAKLL